MADCDDNFSPHPDGLVQKSLSVVQGLSLLHREERDKGPFVFLARSVSGAGGLRVLYIKPKGSVRHQKKKEDWFQFLHRGVTTYSSQSSFYLLTRQISGLIPFRALTRRSLPF